MINNYQHIINALIVNVSFTQNLGLLHGKMGIAIIFFKLSRKYNNQHYRKYAGELIDEIYEEISPETPVDFENGLAGIGWGIEYLIQNKFLESQTENVLEECDNLIIDDLKNNRLNDEHKTRKLLGAGFYFLIRFKNPKTNPSPDALNHVDKIITWLLKTLDKTLNNQILESILHSEVSLEEERNNFSVPNHFGLNDYPQQKQTLNGCLFSGLIWLFAELCTLGFCDSLVVTIIDRVLNTLTQFTPIKHQNNKNLLIASSLIKLHKSLISNSDVQNLSIETEILSAKLLDTISREGIISSLYAKNLSVQNGISGIACLYNILHKSTGCMKYKLEADFWMNKAYQQICTEKICNKETEVIYLSKNDLGIIHGVAGLLVNNALN